MYLGQLEGGDPMSVCACSGLQSIPFGSTHNHRFRLGHVNGKGVSELT